MSRIKVRRWKVASPHASTCGSMSVRDLDFSLWWTDGMSDCVYLKVRGKGEWSDTYHRVFCKATPRPRLEMSEGTLYWLIDESAPRWEDYEMDDPSPNDKSPR